ncbi:MAG: hypothetical protein WC515_08950, partial [Candidatus Omnitrophota bacterium]
PATLNSGAPYTVTWDNLDLQAEIPNAKFEFYDGSAWHNIDYKTTDTGIVPNSESYSWSVPIDVRDVDCQFRISDPANSSATDDTTTFEIRPVIDVTAPTATAKWTIGTQTGNDIVWSETGPVSAVKIEYSKDNGSNYTYTIESSYLGSSPYEWNIPVDQDIITTHTLGSEQKARIKVSDTSLGTIYDESGLFMVKAAITVTNPNSSSVALKVGEISNIEWTTTCAGAADMGDVKIQFRKDAGESWTDVATVAFSASPYTLWAPSLTSAVVTNDAKTAMIQILDADNSEVSDVSDLFEIEGKITFDSPLSAGLMWTVGSNDHEVRWTPAGTYGPIKIEYSTNGFTDELQTHYITSVANSANGVQGVWEWDGIPNDLSDNVKIRLSHENDDDVKCMNPNPIKIVGSIEVTAPETAGIVWKVGETDKVIGWNSNGSITNVDIYYKTSAAGGYSLIVNNDGNHVNGGNTYTWTAGVADENSEDCYIKVCDHAHANDIYNVSTVAFSIRPLITVSVPAADQNLVVGSNDNTVTWNCNSANVTKVDIYYSKTGVGGTYDQLISDGVTCVQGANSYINWDNVDDDISGDVVIKVRDKTNDIVNDLVYGLSSSFDIIGKITVVEPHSGENLYIGASKTISWTRNGTLGDVDVYYFHDGAYELITTVDANSHAWTVPHQLETNTTVKVVDADTTGTADEVNDLSDTFNITAAISVSEPHLNENLSVGTAKTITWDTGTAKLGNLKIYYKHDGSYEYIDTVDGNTVSTYNWASVPPQIEVNTQVKVVAANKEGTSDEVTGESSQFNIKGNFVMVNPPATLNSGAPYTVTWDNLDLQAEIPNAKLEFYDGSAWHNIDYKTTDTGIV